MFISIASLPNLFTLRPGRTRTMSSSVTSGSLLIAYCLLAFEKADAVNASIPWYQLSILPFVLGVLRYALLVDQGHGEAPEEVVLGDRALQVIGVLWVVLYGLGVYAS